MIIRAERCIVKEAWRLWNNWQSAWQKSGYATYTRHRSWTSFISMSAALKTHCDKLLQNIELNKVNYLFTDNLDSSQDEFLKKITYIYHIMLNIWFFFTLLPPLKEVIFDNSSALVFKINSKHVAWTFISILNDFIWRKCKKFPHLG